MLFRKGLLTVVIATSTIAKGLNKSCKTVVFTGDSVFLSALNYRQAYGRAGRRGFELLGNVAFHNIPAQRAAEIISAELPDLLGAVKSLLTQTQLFLGGPHAQMTINHHLRFLIDYLRQHELLSSEGAPLNFAGLVGHLYFTENAVFAFHTLLKAGYLHELCAEICSRRSAVLLEMMLVLSHLFCCIPCLKPRDDVKRSPSVVILPNLPKKAYHFLKTHNRDTLETFRAYDFYKHGDLTALVRDNGIKRGHVWFRLKDFFVILATITTSLGNFLDPKAKVDSVVMADIQDASDILEEEGGAQPRNGSVGVGGLADAIASFSIPKTARTAGGKGKQKAVVDSWEDESSPSDGLAEDSSTDRIGQGLQVEEVHDGAGSVPSWLRKDGKSLTNVYKAFQQLQSESDKTSKKVWA
ncbi:hypothetical protein JX266_011386 [Neoarthrinium moseri]|nr:hypothetical protein JX266_011386 [Neoarthrinium moseri]